MIKIELSTNQLLVINKEGSFDSSNKEMTHEELVSLIRENFSHVKLVDLLDSAYTTIEMSDIDKGSSMMTNIKTIKSQMLDNDLDLAHSLLDLLLSNGDVLSHIEKDMSKIYSKYSTEKDTDSIKVIQLAKEGLDNGDYALANSIFDYLVDNKEILGRLEYQVMEEEGEIVMSKSKENLDITEKNLDFLKLYISEKNNSKQPKEDIELALVELLNQWSVPEMINEILNDNPLLIFKDINRYVAEKYNLTLTYSYGILHLKLVSMYDYNNIEEVVVAYNAMTSDKWSLVTSVNSDRIYSNFLQDEELFNSLKVSLKTSLQNLIRKSLSKK